MGAQETDYYLSICHEKSSYHAYFWATIGGKMILVLEPQPRVRFLLQRPAHDFPIAT